MPPHVRVTTLAQEWAILQQSLPEDRLGVNLGLPSVPFGAFATVEFDYFPHANRLSSHCLFGMVTCETWPTADVRNLWANGHFSEWNHILEPIRQQLLDGLKAEM